MLFKNLALMMLCSWWKGFGLNEWKLLIWDGFEEKLINSFQLQTTPLSLLVSGMFTDTLRKWVTSDNKVDALIGNDKRCALS